MAFSRFRIILLSSFFICLFLCVVLVVNFEEPLNYRYMHQLSKLKFNYMFGSRLQINDTEGKRINDSEKKSGDRGCTTCTGSNFEDKTFEVKCAGKCLTNRACQTITCSSKFQLGYEAAQFSINKEDCSQVLNFWKKELTGCAKIYRDIAASPIQWQTEEDVIKNITELQKCQWHKQELAAEEFRSELKRCCNAVSDCLVTQKNTPVGTELTYEAEPKRKLKITHQIFAIFPKNSSFSSRQYKRCAVIGNGGILTNSSCGAEIDQADFVFRCNLPPVGGQFTQDVGTKTNLVTANPSIIAERYSELHDRRRPFFTNLIVYNDALLLLPAFSYTINTGRSFRALYTLQDFQAKQKVVFFNPVYLNRLAGFWRTRGIQVKRLSTGIMIVSLALELCEEVWIYGFWPFGKDIEGKVMPHHYFDNQLPKPSIHSMPTEFHHLLQMHSKGMIKLQMTHCRANPK